MRNASCVLCALRAAWISCNDQKDDTLFGYLVWKMPLSAASIWRDECLGGVYHNMTDDVLCEPTALVEI